MSILNTYHTPDLNFIRRRHQVIVSCKGLLLPVMELNHFSAVEFELQGFCILGIRNFKKSCYWEIILMVYVLIFLEPDLLYLFFWPVWEAWVDFLPFCIQLGASYLVQFLSPSIPVGWSTFGDKFFGLLLTPFWKLQGEFDACCL